MTFEPHIAFLRARFSPEGQFGLHLTAGSVALIGSAWLSGGVAEDLITGDPLTLVDAFISQWFRIHAAPSISAWMTLVSALASTAVVLGVSTVACIVLPAPPELRAPWSVSIQTEPGLLPEGQ